MIIVSDASKDDFILCFLQCEIDSERFCEGLKEALKSLDLDEKIVLQPDLTNEDENRGREKLLSLFRGYGTNEGLFKNFPNVKGYKRAVLDSKDLNSIKYINYSYWNELSNNTSSPLVAAENIKRGKVVYDVSNDAFIKGAEILEDGQVFKPMILLTSDFKEFIILEGHSRATIYGLKPHLFKNVECYILQCDEEELKNWNK